MYQVLHYQDPNPKVLFKFNSNMNKYEFFILKPDLIRLLEIILIWEQTNIKLEQIGHNREK